MSKTALELKPPQFVVDSKGRRRSVVLSVADYERLIERLEDLEDTLALDEAVRSRKQCRNYADIQAELQKAGRL